MQVNSYMYFQNKASRLHCAIFNTKLNFFPSLNKIVLYDFFFFFFAWEKNNIFLYPFIWGEEEVILKVVIASS